MTNTHPKDDSVRESKLVQTLQRARVTSRDLTVWLMSSRQRLRQSLREIKLTKQKTRKASEIINNAVAVGIEHWRICKALAQSAGTSDNPDTEIKIIIAHDIYLLCQINEQFKFPLNEFEPWSDDDIAVFQDEIQNAIKENVLPTTASNSAAVTLNTTTSDPAENKVASHPTADQISEVIQKLSSILINKIKELAENKTPITCNSSGEVQTYIISELQKNQDQAVTFIPQIDKTQVKELFYIENSQNSETEQAANYEIQCQIVTQLLGSTSYDTPIRRFRAARQCQNMPLAAANAIVMQSMENETTLTGAIPCGKTIKKITNSSRGPVQRVRNQHNNHNMKPEFNDLTVRAARDGQVSPAQIAAELGDEIIKALREDLGKK